MGQPEGRLQKKIQDALNKEFPGSFFVKIHGGPYQKKGIPDIIGCVKGTFIAIEVKLPGKEKKTTKLQETTIEDIRTAGGIAFVSSSVDHSIEMVKTLLEGG